MQVAAGVQCRRFPQEALLSLICWFIEDLNEVQKGVSFQVFFTEFFHGEKFRLFLNGNLLYGCEFCTFSVKIFEVLKLGVFLSDSWPGPIEGLCKAYLAPLFFLLCEI